jgi:hypothetical protein
MYKTLPSKKPSKLKSGDRAPSGYYYDPKGIEGEDRVKSYLASIGKDVKDSDVLEDIRYDIDCYVNGVSTSIKCEHDGAKYGHIYMELVTQVNTRTPWSDDALALVSSVIPKDLGFSTDTWYPAWLLTGKAEQYAILQGDRLRLYYKPDIMAAIHEGNFVHVKGLGWKRLQTQNGLNTVCVFLKADGVPIRREYTL